jgi:hypothetical protein
MPESRTFQYLVGPISERKKLHVTMLELVQSDTVMNGAAWGIFSSGYRTETMDAGKPMPALVFLTLTLNSVFGEYLK